ncbi:MAG: SufD family Fe-S cluster assembly protein [Desulfurococcales archaeon]|nr:SufD family Fe-S cluster assembly protein [Desulfurococcales archaeon]
MSLIQKEKYRDLIEKLPFQQIGDTPTVRYYTDWKVFESRLNLDYASSEDKLPGFLSKLKPNITLGLSLRATNVPEGVIVEDLTKVLEVRPMAIAGVNTKMQAYHAYRWNTGAYIKITDESSIEDLVIVSLGGDGYLGHHIIIDIGERANARIKIIDYGGPNASLKTLITEMTARNNSKLEVDILSLYHELHASFIQHYLRIEDQAEAVVRILTSGGSMTRFESDNLLLGRLSKLDAKASNVARPSTKTDFLLNAVHKGPESEGFIGARGVVLGDGYLAQRGLAKIDHEASWASSEVESHVTILGERGRGYAVPMLEIHTGDVTKAGHSASVTTIQEDHLFYLRSRGLNRDELERMLITGAIEYSSVASSLGIDPLEIFLI